MTHRKAVTLAVFLACGSPFHAALHAQTLGVLGGWSRTTLAGTDVPPGLEHRTGFLTGLSVMYALSSHASLEVDALYASKGYQSKTTNNTFDFSSSYLEIPLLLRIALVPAARVRPFVVAGPAFSAQLDCHGTNTSSTGSVDINCTDLVARSGILVKKTDVSAVLGGGVELPLGAVEITIATRYTMGFASVIGNNDNHNRALSVYVGLSKGHPDRNSAR